MVILLLCLVPPIISMLCGWHLKFETVSATLGLLVGVSGAIFTIMSIWIAFLYPNVLRTLKGDNLVNADFSSSGGDTTRLKIIVGVIVQSALSMAFSLIGMLFVSFYEGFGFKTQEITLAIMQFLLVFFSGLQISTIISVIHINSSFVKNLEGKNKARARDWDT
ncbi:hypothetical protein N5K35_03165 [Pseudomonas sp. GD03651]|jgi:hypothetical protein|uniref:hypothetical protein n=1 Tax=Pseudomonas TaxID=286 RepID=UPI0016510CA5|nr:MULTISPECIES: hypothetical protein [Pseudomonas]MDH2182718.1 hypothetical protein [Pseudomonas sp. GD03651]